MERKMMDDDMGFVKVDHEMGYNKVDDDVEYVKVEKADADMEHEQDKVSHEQQKVDADVEYEEKVDADMEYDKGNENSNIPPRPLPRRTKDMNLQDVVKDIILPFLPAKSLARFRSISKEWDRWIRSPFLAHQQSYYFKDFSGFFCQFSSGRHTFVSLDNTAYGIPFPSLKFLPEPVNIISSCNGLLLCHGHDALDPYYVCNPATQEWTVLPPPQLYHGDKPSAILAFEPSALNMGADYNLLCVIPTFDNVFLFELYSSTTGSWEVCETTLVEMEDVSIKGNGFYMNGIAYMETSTRKVIAFHLFTKLYEVICLPSGTPSDGILTQVDGELCYIGLSCLSENEYSVMIYTGMDLGLRGRLDLKVGPELNGPALYRVLPCLDGDNVMIVVGSNVYSYSTTDQSIEVVTGVGSIAYLASAKCVVAYVNSLVEVAKPPVFANLTDG